MKNLILALILTLTASTSNAGCVALDYQEMKDMSADELVVEWCAVRSTIDTNMSAMIEDIGRKSNAAEEAIRRDSLDQCLGQAKRIERALESKGVLAKELPVRCKADSPKAK